MCCFKSSRRSNFSLQTRHEIGCFGLWARWCALKPNEDANLDWQMLQLNGSSSVWEQVWRFNSQESVFARMQARVSHQMVIMFKFRRADTANIWTLVCMWSHVMLQITRLWKLYLTDWQTLQVYGRSPVCIHTSVEIGRLDKLLLTNSARKLPLIHMPVQV